MEHRIIASGDGHFEVIIRADKDQPVEVLGVLVHELVHAVLPPDAGHGPKYREAAVKIGLEGQMRHAMPNPLLKAKLEAIAATLGPLPHAALNLEYSRDGTRPADKPKKQTTRLLKAECAEPECGYTVRITAKWVQDIGLPNCPKHGKKMAVDVPPAGGSGERLNALPRHQVPHNPPKCDQPRSPRKRASAPPPAVPAGRV